MSGRWSPGTAVYLRKRVRQALPSQFGVTIRFYIVAALLLPPRGTAFGGICRLSGALHSQFLLAHEAVDDGFVGITAVGTLVTFWPTMRTKMVDKALTQPRALYLILRWLVALTVVGAILGVIRLLLRVWSSTWLPC